MPPMPAPDAAGQHIELVQHEDLAVVASRPRRPCRQCALPSSATRNSELRPRQPRLERGDRMPVVGDRGDPLSAIDRVVGRVPGLDQQRADRRQGRARWRCGRTSPSISMPSLALTSSLTACGLALPPVAFITWPTNQPAMVGLARACSALSGLAAITSSTAFSMAPVSVTCFMPRLSTNGARVAALVPDDLEQVLGDLAGDGAFLDQVDDRAELVGRNRSIFNVFAGLVQGARADR